LRVTAPTFVIIAIGVIVGVVARTKWISGEGSSGEGWKKRLR